MEQIEPRPWHQPVYRFIGSRFLGNPLSAAGSTHHGGRFNPPGTFEVLYTALAADTVLAEREGILLTDTAIKLAPAIRTGVLLRIRCQLVAVLDLVDPKVRERLRIKLADLVGPWIPWNWQPTATDERARAAASEKPATPIFLAPSQRIGAAVHRSGRFEAILAPSAKDPAGRCLAIFPEHLRRGSAVSIDDPDGTITAALGIEGLRQSSRPR